MPPHADGPTPCSPGIVTPPEDNALVSDALDELTSVMGCSKRQASVPVPGGWDDGAVLSGIFLPTAERMLWRFTAQLTPSNPTPESFIVSHNSTVLVLAVPQPNGTTTTYTLPGASVLQPPGAPVSKVGMWLAADESSAPVSELVENG